MNNKNQSVLLSLRRIREKGVLFFFQRTFGICVLLSSSAQGWPEWARVTEWISCSLHRGVTLSLAAIRPTYCWPLGLPLFICHNPVLIPEATSWNEDIFSYQQHIHTQPRLWHCLFSDDAESSSFLSSLPQEVTNWKCMCLWKSESWISVGFHVFAFICFPWDRSH